MPNGPSQALRDQPRVPANMTQDPDALVPVAAPDGVSGVLGMVLSRFALLERPQDIAEAVFENVPTNLTDDQKAAIVAALGLVATVATAGAVSGDGTDEDPVTIEEDAITEREVAPNTITLAELAVSIAAIVREIDNLASDNRRRTGDAFTEKVWKTDGDGVPAWRDESTGAAGVSANAANIARIVNTAAYRGDWRSAAAFTNTLEEGDVVRHTNANWRYVAAASGSSAEPVANLTAIWLRLSGIESAIADFHRHLTTLAGARSFADLTGMIADDQIPGSIARDSEVAAAVMAEADARAQADMAEAQARATADDLKADKTALAAEAQARADADTALGQRIDNLPGPGTGGGVTEWASGEARSEGDLVYTEADARSDVYFVTQDIAANSTESTTAPSQLSSHYLELDNYNGEWVPNHAWPKGHIVDVRISARERHWYISQQTILATDPAPNHEDNFKWLLFGGGRLDLAVLGSGVPELADGFPFVRDSDDETLRATGTAVAGALITKQTAYAAAKAILVHGGSPGARADDANFEIDVSGGDTPSAGEDPREVGLQTRFTSGPDANLALTESGNNYDLTNAASSITSLTHIADDGTAEFIARRDDIDPEKLYVIDVVQTSSSPEVAGSVVLRGSDLIASMGRVNTTAPAAGILSRDQRFAAYDYDGLTTVDPPTRFDVDRSTSFARVYVTFYTAVAGGGPRLFARCTEGGYAIRISEMTSTAAVIAAASEASAFQFSSADVPQTNEDATAVIDIADATVTRIVGDAESPITIDTSADSFTIERGVYLFEIAGEMRANQNNAAGQFVNLALDNSVLQHTSSIFIPQSNEWQEFVINGIYATPQRFSGKVGFRPIRRNVAARNLTYRIVPITGASHAVLPGLASAFAGNRGMWVARRPDNEEFHYVNPPLRIVTTPWAANQTHFRGTVLPGARGTWWALTGSDPATGITGAEFEPGNETHAGTPVWTLFTHPLTDSLNDLLDRLAILRYAFEDEHTKTWQTQTDAATQGGWFSGLFPFAQRTVAYMSDDARPWDVTPATHTTQVSADVEVAFRIPRDRAATEYRLSYEYMPPPGFSGAGEWHAATRDLATGVILEDGIASINLIGSDEDWHYYYLQWEAGQSIRNAVVQEADERVRWLGDVLAPRIGPVALGGSNAARVTVNLPSATVDFIKSALKRRLGIAVTVTYDETADVDASFAATFRMTAEYEDGDEIRFTAPVYTGVAYQVTDTDGTVQTVINNTNLTLFVTATGARLEVPILADGHPSSGNEVPAAYTIASVA